MSVSLVPVVMDHLTVEREHTCLQMLTWRCTLSQPRPELEAVLTGLQRAGYRDRSSLPGLRVLEHPDRHTVSVVEATGRIQLKIHYLVEGEQRVATALKLATQLNEVCDAIERNV